MGVSVFSTTLAGMLIGKIPKLLRIALFACSDTLFDTIGTYCSPRVNLQGACRSCCLYKGISSASWLSEARLDSSIASPPHFNLPSNSPPDSNSYLIIALIRRHSHQLVGNARGVRGAQVTAAAMAKRRNENGQMRREEYDAAEDAGSDSLEIGFQRASDDSIRKRKIVKARVGGRSGAKPKAAAGADDAAKSNPFGGFQVGLELLMLAEAKPALISLAACGGEHWRGDQCGDRGVVPAGDGGPQQGVPGLRQWPVTEEPECELGGRRSGLQRLLACGRNDRGGADGWGVRVLQDYLKYADEIAAKHAATKPVAIEESKSAAPAPLSFGSTSAPPAPASSSSSFSFGDNKKTDEPAKSGGFSFGGASKKADDPAKSPAKPATGGFSFGATAKKDDETAKSPAKPAVGGFSFGGAAKKDGETAKSPAKPGFSFGGSSSLFSAKSSESEKVTPAFSFGAMPKPAAVPTTSTPATGGFSFGNSSGSKPSAPASGGFSFGASAPAASTSATASTAAAAGDEDEETVGREEATVIIKADTPDDDCTFETDKAKVFEFKKDEKRWADKGVHPLKVLVSKDTKSARILVRNEIGKIVLNSALYKGMAVRPHEAKGKKTGVTLALQVEGGELSQFLLKVNSARVDEFIKALESAAASS
ncbi:unnamed protein product [Phytophthora fragariaefolia]|uniref:Unnamed protein product n=1 Tax=Phytophthora fragariaefolia TaxID=1490495 RepID=A0A9W7D025_9STRA|nr:unnamed protein product [Phytophthora fragariaefolia]